jgi:hypothetical protein
MKIFKTAVYFSDCQESKIYRVDTIEYEGMFWLVPEWNDFPEAGVTMPDRIICLDGLVHQETSPDAAVQFVLNNGIPRSVYDGQIPIGDKYVVIKNPDIRFPLQNETS